MSDWCTRAIFLYGGESRLVYSSGGSQGYAGPNPGGFPSAGPGYQTGYQSPAPGGGFPTAVSGAGGFPVYQSPSGYHPGPGKVPNY